MLALFSKSVMAVSVLAQTGQQEMQFSGLQFAVLGYIVGLVLLLGYGLSILLRVRRLSRRNASTTQRQTAAD